MRTSTGHRKKPARCERARGKNVQLFDDQQEKPLPNTPHSSPAPGTEPTGADPGITGTDDLGDLGGPPAEGTPEAAVRQLLDHANICSTAVTVSAPTLTMDQVSTLVDHLADILDVTGNMISVVHTRGVTLFENPPADLQVQVDPRDPDHDERRKRLDSALLNLAIAHNALEAARHLTGHAIGDFIAAAPNRT